MNYQDANYYYGTGTVPQQPPRPPYAALLTSSARPRSAPNPLSSDQIAADLLPSPPFDPQYWVEGSSSAPYVCIPSFRSLLISNDFQTPPGYVPAYEQQQYTPYYGTQPTHPTYSTAPPYAVPSPIASAAYPARRSSEPHNIMLSGGGTGIHYSHPALPPTTPPIPSTVPDIRSSAFPPGSMSGRNARTTPPDQQRVVVPSLPMNVFPSTSVPLPRQAQEKLACYPCRRGKIGCRRPAPEAMEQRCK